MIQLFSAPRVMCSQQSGAFALLLRLSYQCVDMGKALPLGLLEMGVTGIQEPWSLLTSQLLPLVSSNNLLPVTSGATCLV